LGGLERHSRSQGIGEREPQPNWDGSTVNVGMKRKRPVAKTLIKPLKTSRDEQEVQN